MRATSYPPKRMALKASLSPLLTEEVVSKLRRCGIGTVVKVLTCGADVVARASGLSLSHARHMQHELLKACQLHTVCGRSLLQEAEEQHFILPFGCESVDSLLKGGVFTGEITEICGPPASGKTQLCLCLSGWVVRESPYTVCYIDGNAGGFSSMRLHHLLTTSSGVQSTSPSIMEKLRVFRVFSVFELISLLSSLYHHIANQTSSFYGNIRLVVVDPVTLYLAPHLTVHQNQGHALMLELVKVMRSLCHDHSLALVCCNNVVTSKGGTLKPALGQTWLSSLDTRLHLSVSSLPPGDSSIQRTITISTSPRQVAGETVNFHLP